MGINYLVIRHEYRQGEYLRSHVLIADSMHTKSDIYVSLSVIVSLVAIKFGYPMIEENEICQLVMRIKGVKGCHKIRTRGSIGDIKVDMHLLLQSDMSLEDAHLVSHRVSKKLKEEYKDISDVVVHLEPSAQQPQESNSKKTS